MGAMAMPQGEAMSMVWMPMCGQSWLAAAASFLGMWTVMMAAMMLPSWVPALWRYRHSAGEAGELPRAATLALVAVGYLLVWVLLGAAVYPLGSLLTTMAARAAWLTPIVPFATGLMVLIGGALQFTRWKARHLACCRRQGSRQAPRCGRVRPAGALTAVRQGLRLGLHCSQCCAGLTAVLLVCGIMDVPAMVAVTAGITLERLAPAGERIARAIGVIVAGSGLLMIARAAALS
jgi:predicted metal-binding membrane protein